MQNLKHKTLFGKFSSYGGDNCKANDKRLFYPFSFIFELAVKD